MWHYKCNAFDIFNRMCANDSINFCRGRVRILTFAAHETVMRHNINENIVLKHQIYIAKTMIFVTWKSRESWYFPLKNILLRLLKIKSQANFLYINLAFWFERCLILRTRYNYICKYFTSSKMTTRYNMMYNEKDKYIK